MLTSPPGPLRVDDVSDGDLEDAAHVGSPLRPARRLHLVRRQLVPWRDAKLHVLSHGLHYGSCVFEGERAYGGRDLQIDRALRAPHAARPSCSISRSPIRSPRSTPPSAWSSTKNGQRDAYVRPVAWRGSEMMGVSAQNNTIHLAIAAWEWPSYFDPARAASRASASTWPSIAGRIRRRRPARPRPPGST